MMEELEIALMRAMVDGERKEAAIVRFKLLKIKLQDVRNLADEKLPEGVVVVIEVPVV